MRIHHGSVPALGIGATALLIAVAQATAATSTAAQPPAHPATVKPIPASTGHIDARTLTSPLPTSQCLTQLHLHCYSPLQYRVAFNLNDLYRHHITGQGRTIVIVDSFGSPTIQHDLDTFDAQWGLPDTTVHIMQAGVIPPFDPTNSDMAGWAGETSLDVEYAHAIAPGAKIVLVETPVSETEGVQGFPEMMTAEKHLIDQSVGDVITQSFGATENTFPGFAQGDFSSLLNLRFAFKAAAERGVTVLASSGDDGATDAELDATTLYPFRVNSWPSSDPLVTSIGGTQLTLNDAGTRLSPDVVWNDGSGAGGGGLSGVFGRPRFQNGVAAVVGARRGTPDISMPASVDGGAWVYYTFNPPRAGWHVIGGTSEASPIFSGVVALADQVAGHRLGNINAALYELGLGRHPDRAGIIDVTSGNNTFAGVTGFSAAPGYDLASGWGTINAPDFVRALARESRD